MLDADDPEPFTENTLDTDGDGVLDVIDEDDDNDGYLDDDDAYPLNPWLRGSGIEFEANDSLETAQEISLDTAYIGNLSSPSDYDVYKFTLDEAGTLQLFMDNEEYTQGGFRFDLVDEDNYYRASDECIYDECVGSVNELKTELTRQVFPTCGFILSIIHGVLMAPTGST